MTGTLAQHITNAFNDSFVQLCLEILIKGYNETITSGEYDSDWIEDNLTAQLIFQMEKLQIVRKNQISINPQAPLYSSEMKKSGVSSKTAPVIDMKISTWESDVEHRYYFEAKNLSENNWKKTNGASVSANYYINRYVDTGIKNFIDGKYTNGSIIGYVVQGTTSNILNKLNSKISIEHPSLGLISNRAPIISHSDSFISNNMNGNEEIVIRHTFLDFTT